MTGEQDVTHARRALGAHGEELVARWYAGRGYVVLDRNWRGPGGELDVIAERDGTVVFCEVKARTSSRFGTPFEAVTPRKQQRIRRLAVSWLEAHPSADHRRRGVRFDVAGVTGGVRVEVLEGAF